MISKAPSEYIKTVPQHIRAAKLLESIREIKKGDIISYVKIINKPGVKPVEMARQDEVDSKKYMEFMESTLDQITSSMGLDFDQILGKPKQTGLDQFFEYVWIELVFEGISLTILGVIAGILILSGWVHQIVKGYRTKSLKDVSKYLMVLIGIGAFLWLIYGLEVNDIYIIGTNVAAIILMLIVFIMKRKYDRKPRIQN